jgi:hypothetical protein
MDRSLHDQPLGVRIFHDHMPSAVAAERRGTEWRCHNITVTLLPSARETAIRIHAPAGPIARDSMGGGVSGRGVADEMVNAQKTAWRLLPAWDWV